MPGCKMHANPFRSLFIVAVSDKVTSIRPVVWTGSQPSTLMNLYDKEVEHA
ncbi:hypothetical protein KTT_47040 [Tengunoibacter tsumagoiensis]|uniref:Uncharacterized protein n=1 Tax=Tengunoibacter tsumagoiensis TaxID=2014871 RepID=A0A402A733_9CHLR|nr:hypothetical protein KTT_47040 [Tengunoibacter tsumagoiensis]